MPRAPPPRAVTEVREHEICRKGEILLLSSSFFLFPDCLDFGFGQKASPFPFVLPSVPRQLAEEWRESEEMAKGQTERERENEKWWNH